MFSDGQSVFLPDGEQGKIIATSATGCYVSVTTGSLANEILLLPYGDLTSLSSYVDDGLEDSLDSTASIEPMLAASTPEEMAEEIASNLLAVLRTKSGMMVHSALTDNYLREGAKLVLLKAIELIEE
jgi:hypothetical protein